MDAGFVSCRGAGEVYFTTLDGETYAVHGVAKTHSEIPPVQQILADDPTGDEQWRNLGVLVAEGLLLCEERSA